MLTQLSSLALIILLGAMLPGPDFAIVTKNTLLHSRRSGIYTSIGVSSAIIIHMTYCIFGLAVLISSSLWLFNLIKYIGAAYLIYLGLGSLLSKHNKPMFSNIKTNTHHHDLRPFTAFRQGFLTNLLNPKATLFFLSIFTVIIDPNASLLESLVYALEIILITLMWFCSLTLILSHRLIKQRLEKAENLIAKLLGIFLIGFGLFLIFVEK